MYSLALEMHAAFKDSSLSEQNGETGLQVGLGKWHRKQTADISSLRIWLKKSKKLPHLELDHQASYALSAED